MELKKIGKNIWDRFSFFLLFTKPEQLCVCILTSKSYWFFKALVNLLSFKKNHLAVITVHICLLKCNWICSDSLRKWLLLVVLMRALPAHMLRNIAKKNSSWQAVLRWPWFLCFCSGGGGYFSFFLSTQTEVCCTEISVLQQHASNTKHFFFFPLFLFFLFSASLPVGKIVGSFSAVQSEGNLIHSEFSSLWSKTSYSSFNFKMYYYHTIRFCWFWRTAPPTPHLIFFPFVDVK